MPRRAAARKPDLLRSLSGAATMQASDKREQAVQLRRLAEEAERPHDRAYLNRLAQSRDREAQELEVRERIGDLIEANGGSRGHPGSRIY
jgi:hypothetical protein